MSIKAAANVKSDRLDEMLDKFAELSDADFEAWMAEQPDQKELGLALIDLCRTDSIPG